MNPEKDGLPIYLDYNATTPLDPRVFEVMKEWYLGPPANSGSRTHVYGQRAKDAVENARQQIAGVVAAQPEEIYFTSGATESNNLAILGLTAYGERTNRKHIISTAIEHKAVLEPLEEMRKRGFEVDLAPVTTGGYVEPDTIRELLRPDTLLVSVMHANNETGVLQPIREIADIVADSDTFFHTDAAQTFGKEVDGLRQVDCDFMSVSSHKIYGPQGVGAIFIRRIAGQKRPLEPIVFGGGQERGLRSGTVPVPLVVGMGEAARLAIDELYGRRKIVLQNREHILSCLSRVEFEENGESSRCQSNVLNIRFPSVDSEGILMALKSALAASNGSACTTTSYEPSHVLLAMGRDEDAANEAVRLSWGHAEVSIPSDLFSEVLARIKITF